MKGTPCIILLKIPVDSIVLYLRNEFHANRMRFGFLREKIVYGNLGLFCPSLQSKSN